MARKWQLQEAKNRLSEVVDLALEEGPQTVTRHGKEVVVVVAEGRVRAAAREPPTSGHDRRRSSAA